VGQILLTGGKLYEREGTGSQAVTVRAHVPFLHSLTVASVECPDSATPAARFVIAATCIDSEDNS